MAGKFEIKVAKNGEFFFNLLASNGQIVLTSEQYKSKASALNGIESVKKNSVLDERYNRLVGKSGKPYFSLKAGNHQVIGVSQQYEDERGRNNGIASVKTNAAKAAVKDLTVA